MVLIAVEAVPVGSKPPAVVGVQIFTGERHGFDASAPLSTRASSLQRRAGGSAIIPKLVKLVESPSTLTEELPPFFTRSAADAPSRALASLIVIFYVCLCGKMWLPSFLLKAC